MLMSVNVSENIPLTSIKFNQSGSEFSHFNQKYEKKHNWEHFETQENDAFESTCKRVLI